MKTKIRLLSLLILLIFSTVTIICIIPNKTNNIKEEHNSILIEQITNNSVSSPLEEIIEVTKNETLENQEPTTEEVTTEEPTPSIEDLVDQMNKEIANIPYDFNDMNQKQDWFLAYKEIISKYPEELHKTTIYELFNEEDLQLLYGVVQAEVGNEYGFIEKANVISVIFNRLGDNHLLLHSVLTAKNQFASPVKGKEIDEKTILACEYVFLFGDTTNGCTSFRSDVKLKKWGKKKYQFSDDAHHFYKNTN